MRSIRSIGLGLLLSVAMIGGAAAEEQASTCYSKASFDADFAARTDATISEANFFKGEKAKQFVDLVNKAFSKNYIADSAAIYHTDLAPTVFAVLFLKDCAVVAGPLPAAFYNERMVEMDLPHRKATEPTAEGTWPLTDTTDTDQ